jgi:IclR family acetate operon transcriptional repressor
MAQNDQYAIKVLSATLDILEFMASRQDDQITVSMLSQELNLNRTRVYRIIKSLEYRGYVEFLAGTKILHLGPKLLVLHTRVWEQHDVRIAAEDQALRLTQATGDSVRLYIPLEGQAYLVDGFPGTNLLRVEHPAYAFFPMHIGASPKVILAYLPAEDCETILQEMDMLSYTPKTITDRDNLERQLELIRCRGYEVALEDMIEGVWAIGAPIFHPADQVVASLELIMPTSTWSPEEEERLIKVVISHANRVSQIWRSDRTFAPAAKWGKF